MTDRRQIPYTQELARKGIHLSSLSIPLIYLHIDRETALQILVPLTLIALVLNLLMYRHGRTRALMMRLIGGMLRGHERDEQRMLLNGASWVLIAATLIIALTPKILAVTSFTTLILSDTFAALIGRKWGRRRFLDKSVLGSSVFFGIAVMIVVVYGVSFALPWTYFAAGLSGAVVCTVVEAASVRLHVDDNLSIPFSMALTMWGLATLFDAQHLPPFVSVLP